jgi:hypothetical protein
LQFGGWLGLAALGALAVYLYRTAISPSDAAARA